MSILPTVAGNHASESHDLACTKEADISIRLGLSGPVDRIEPSLTDLHTLPPEYAYWGGLYDVFCWLPWQRTEGWRPMSYAAGGWLYPGSVSKFSMTPIAWLRELSNAIAYTDAIRETSRSAIALRRGRAIRKRCNHKIRSVYCSMVESHQTVQFEVALLASAAEV